MKTINKTTLIGYVGAAPEIRTTPGGKRVANFSVATTEKWSEGEETTWHRCVAWERAAELIGDMVKKGTPVYIEGRGRNRKYEKEGTEHYSHEIVVEEFSILAPRMGDDASDDAPAAAPAPAGKAAAKGKR
jgi:single-strand DNA-binding protein